MVDRYTINNELSNHFMPCCQVLSMTALTKVKWCIYTNPLCLQVIATKKGKWQGFFGRQVYDGQILQALIIIISKEQSLYSKSVHPQAFKDSFSLPTYLGKLWIRQTPVYMYKEVGQSNRKIHPALISSQFLCLFRSGFGPTARTACYSNGKMHMVI